MKYIRKFITELTALLVYKQTILPHFDYCSFIVDGGKKTMIKALQTLQNRALRVCLRKYSIEYRTNDIHTECKVERLEKRRETQLAILMYKKSVSLGLKPADIARTRGDLKVKFRSRRAVLEKYKKGPMARGIKLWNRLKPIVQQAPTVAAFKRLFSSTPLDPEI